MTWVSGTKGRAFESPIARQFVGFTKTLVNICTIPPHQCLQFIFAHRIIPLEDLKEP